MEATSPTVPVRPARIFSGIQPSGHLHLGNYLGAVQHWVALQARCECLYCVVDLHALTGAPAPEQLRVHIRQTAILLLAAGIDPSRHIVFCQSHVPAHAKLGWICTCLARVSWLNRMTQYKEKTGKDREGASAGLFAYPALMTADILAYHATIVPVGEDQKQHVELARDIAMRFNHVYGDFFALPEPLISGDGVRIMSLRDGTRKMSKSDPADASRINLLDTQDVIADKIRRAKTDADPVPGPEALDERGNVRADVAAARPEVVNLLRILASVAGAPLAAGFERYGGGQFKPLKDDLVEAICARILPVGREFTRLAADTTFVDRVLRDGAERASLIAGPVMREIEARIGLLPPAEK